MADGPDPRHDILFEPVQIGPVTAPNRFYQVPHCTGMGYRYPRSLAAMRGMKAAGGWGIVCTEYCSIDPSSDESPHNTAALWDSDDIGRMRLITDAVHAHGSLAGVELWAGGIGTPNLLTRVPSPAVRSMPAVLDPVQSRAMDLDDIRAFRRQHRLAVRRARESGFDIVYVYPCHGYLLTQMMSRAHNQRSDEYGGSLENRVRLVRELLEDAREEAGNQMAVAIRFSADGHGEVHMGADEAMDAIRMLAHLPDLWDVTIGDYAHEMGSSMFTPPGTLEGHAAQVREITGKPVVTVGRFTSPDAMVGPIRRGAQDLIGAARPSIADPFLPAKIRTGRSDDIRECIGCNICYASDERSVPIRCTQNPTMGEEWRRGWHPERVERDNDGDTVLIVGAGPAGLEAARILGLRGFAVTIAEATREAGGRVTRESRLPGLAEWARVRDYRVNQIRAMTNIDLYLDSRMRPDDVLEFGARHVLVATGSAWRADGTGRVHPLPVPGFEHPGVSTPDAVMDGDLPTGPVLIFDDDHYYMASVLAQKLATEGLAVTYVTPASRPAPWLEHTLEQEQTHRTLLQLGVTIVTGHRVAGFDGEAVIAVCEVTGDEQRITARSVVPVTSREPSDILYHNLRARAEELERAGTETLIRAGDCEAPGIIATAIHAGHRIGRELGLASVPAVRREAQGA
ncbi:FAD-dependent oxidoreductase [Halofilum ochraceum]|uniref:oxidoreductase n=1 Tax=Halofilum ochraceum TaxID=1611323 RepID=UPI0008DB0183|nr:FAD-dependent oxidoreductase [Halofilum ochraceum]